jgi:tRNA threonylcarbamoyladenosine biosynthesis protein TsaE
MLDLIFGPEEIDAAAGQVLDWVREQRGTMQGHHHGPYALSLRGAMGSGKTTLLRAMGQRLGCSPLPSSPTYSLVQQYLTGEGAQVVHADLFRLRDEREWLALDMEILCAGAEWLWVEWPDKAAAFMPAGMAQWELMTWNSSGNDFLHPDQRRLIFRGWVL